MKYIESIEIKNIKGIDNKKIDVEIFANKANILVAPNGFGKSSISAAFLSLKKDKMIVPKDYLHNGKESKDSCLKIVYVENNKKIELIADKNRNTISNEFSVFVINNQIKSEAKVLKFNNFSQATSDMVVKDIILFKTIPKNIRPIYNYSTYKKLFSPNEKICININSYISDDSFIFNIYENRRDLEKIISNKGISNDINIININLSKEKGTKNEIYEIFNNSELTNKILKNVHVQKFIASTFKQDYQSTEKIIFLIEIINFYKENKLNFSDIIKRKKYEKYKNRITNLFQSYNTRSNVIKIVEEKKQLLAKFPKAKLLSNGEIDIFSFLLLLEQASTELTTKKCILVIDEIFDYLDDVNLLTVQSYISRKIMEYKNDNRELYPILLTHLDPQYFKNFYFSDMKISYILKESIAINNDVRNIIINRKELDKKTNNAISKSYLHYSDEDIKLNNNSELGIPDIYNSSKKFQKCIFEELKKYINDEKCDYIMAICGLRVIIEKMAYDNLDIDNKKTFLNEDKTNNRLDYAQSKGIIIPDSFRILSILYNDLMHIDKKNDPQQKKLKYVSIKMKNIIIKNIIKTTVQYIQDNMKN